MISLLPILFLRASYCHVAVMTVIIYVPLVCLKPHSITLASSELAPNMFGASSELALNMFGAKLGASLQLVRS